MSEKQFSLDWHDTELKRPTHEAIQTVAEFEGLNIAVSVVDARTKSDIEKNDGRTIIWPQSYDARIDQFETQRQVTIAEALKARLINVDAPGLGFSEDTKSTVGQKIDLLGGSFDKMSYAMLGAIDEVVDLRDGENVEMLMYSQGLSYGSAMLKHMGKEAFGLKIKVPRITVIEGVNDQPWPLFKLLDAIGKEDAQADRYLKQNENYDWLVLPQDKQSESGKKDRKDINNRQAVTMLLSGAAMRKPAVPDILSAVEQDRSDGTTGISSAQVDFIKFDASGVSRIEKNRLSVKQLTAAMPLGEVALTVVSDAEGIGHTHPAVHSMPNVDVLSRHLVA